LLETPEYSSRAQQRIRFETNNKQITNTLKETTNKTTNEQSQKDFGNQNVQENG
jgi:hypothetical protein